MAPMHSQDSTQATTDNSAGPAQRSARVKQFQCLKCWDDSRKYKAFPRRCELQRHIDNIHDKTRAHECHWPGCRYGNGQPGNLKTHIKNKHSAVPLEPCVHATVGCTELLFTYHERNQHHKKCHYNPKISALERALRDPETLSAPSQPHHTYVKYVDTKTEGSEPDVGEGRQSEGNYDTTIEVYEGRNRDEEGSASLPVSWFVSETPTTDSIDELVEFKTTHYQGLPGPGHPGRHALAQTYQHRPESILTPKTAETRKCDCVDCVQMYRAQLNAPTTAPPTLRDPNPPSNCPKCASCHYTPQDYSTVYLEPYGALASSDRCAVQNVSNRAEDSFSVPTTWTRQSDVRGYPSYSASALPSGHNRPTAGLPFTSYAYPPVAPPNAQIGALSPAVRHEMGTVQDRSAIHWD